MKQLIQMWYRSQKYGIISKIIKLLEDNTMDGLITTLVGIIGTLSGTLLGWFLNSQSYKLGKTKIYATLIKSITIPVQMGDDTTTCESTSSQKYLFECVAYNSKQIPVILKNFHIELLTDRHSNPISAPILLPEISYTEINGIKIGAELALPRQLIMPRTLHEFTFKVNYHNDDIYDSRIYLIAYNEKNKRKKFLLYDGYKTKHNRTRKA